MHLHTHTPKKEEECKGFLSDLSENSDRQKVHSQPTLCASDRREGSEEARLLARHRHDLDSGLDTVHGVDHQPQAGAAKAAAEHDGSHAYRQQRQLLYTSVTVTCIRKVKANLARNDVTAARPSV